MSAEPYLGLARKYRPQDFDDLIGQEAVADGLRRALQQGRLTHGHLLAGPRGTGKTTTARILARALNCVEGPTARPCGKCRHCVDIAAGIDMDVIEIDAASNTGVDNIRELREQINLAPFAARHKVYIIDEVHMLSISAFNALLKTLEEPPPGVIFIFATTELEKVPETIRSRCVLHQFRRLTNEDIVRRLGQVVEREGITIDKQEAAEIFGMIARSVDGGMRDAMVTLDQLLALSDGKPTLETAHRLLGLADSSMLAETLDWLAGGDAEALLKLVDDLVARGRSLERFVKELVAYLRDVMLLQTSVDSRLVGVKDNALERARRQAESIAPETLYNMLNQLFDLEVRLKKSTQARFLVEFAFLRMARVRRVVPIDDIMRRIAAIPDTALPRTQHPAPARVDTPVRRQETAVETAPQAATVHTIAPEKPAAAPARPPLAAVMLDSASEAPAPESPAAGPEAATPPPESLAGLDRDALTGLIVSQLPDVHQGLFSRYLRQATAIEVDGGALRLSWAANSLARSVMERPDNVRVLEAVLTQIAGRPMKVVNVEASAGASAQPAPAAAPARSMQAPAAPAAPAVPLARSFSDSRPLPLNEDGDVAPESGEDDDGAGTSERPAAAPRVEQAVDTRSARERAIAFMNLSEEAARRLKLLRDMFNGTLIDEQGQPLNI